MGSYWDTEALICCLSVVCLWREVVPSIGGLCVVYKYGYAVVSVNELKLLNKSHEKLQNSKWKLGGNARFER